MAKTISRTLILLRKEADLSQKEVANQLGVSQALLSHYEKGIRECGLDFLVKAADYYNVSCDFLLGRSPEKSGALIDGLELPEVDSNSNDKLFRGNVLAIIHKRLMVNTMQIIFDLLTKIGNTALTSEIANILGLAIYKCFRILTNANPKSQNEMFAYKYNIAKAKTTALTAISEVNAEILAEEIVFNKKNPNEILITDETLTNNYSEYKTSLLHLIKHCEDALTLDIKK